MNRLAWPIAALAGTVGFLLALVVLRTGSSPAPGSSPSARAASSPLVVQATSDPVPAASGVDFAAVARRVNAAVVNIDAATRGDNRPRSPQWRREFPDDPSAPHDGTGSGFFIDPTGFILTNFHVIDGADRITVSLTDGRVFTAAVAGVDPALDVALLKVASSRPFPTALLGDSGRLQVGQWVCAIGNPLGYVHSVTVGVVSFLGRKLFDETLDAYIQTDAAISLGNSGGPLIDAGGRIIGITTAISSQAANIGFAIPINQVLNVLPQLRERGRVSRGDIGVGLTRITPELQSALALNVDRGALVHAVGADSPAERAGLHPYDVVVAAGDEPVQTDEDLLRQIAARAPGTLVSLRVVRDTATSTIVVKLGDRPGRTRARASASSIQPAAGRDQGPLGLQVRDLDPAWGLRRSLPDTIQGVIVVDVDAAGPARQARIRPGQLVLEINRRPTPTAAQFQNALARVNRAAALLIYDPITEQRYLVTILPDRHE
ncbi:MAG TPA: trypsin-like peptidase domain-containing protein [Vicinamibacterales bacterium]|nr:trypsin-like peptidase domain-containing protein [Vicinamibacterales bacterium]